MKHSSDIAAIFSEIRVPLPALGSTNGLAVVSPIDAKVLGVLAATTAQETNACIDRAAKRFKTWRTQPAPVRGAVVRAWGELVRTHKPALAKLITLEAGKIVQESLGEVQEVVDICDFAIGLSRQLYGLTIASERHQHKLLETWHPIGPVGVLSAFNFPMAVYAWNAALALVCGDTVVWKPSEKTPYCALALQGLLLEAVRQCGVNPVGLVELLIGDASLGEALTSHTEIKLLSATGSTRMGAAVAAACAPSFKRTLLELGGNNAAIVCPSANLDLVTRATVFSAVGTAGQRCTTLRRLIVHRSIYQAVIDRLLTVYRKLPIGDPRVVGTLVGPLVDKRSYETMQVALERAAGCGGEVHFGERISVSACEAGYYIRPAIISMASQLGRKHPTCTA